MVASIECTNYLSMISFACSAVLSVLWVPKNLVFFQSKCFGTQSTEEPQGSLRIEWVGMLTTGKCDHKNISIMVRLCATVLLRFK